jgi:hypothetical protein
LGVAHGSQCRPPKLPLLLALLFAVVEIVHVVAASSASSLLVMVGAAEVESDGLVAFPFPATQRKTHERKTLRGIMCAYKNNNNTHTHTYSSEKNEKNFGKSDFFLHVMCPPRLGPLDDVICFLPSSRPANSRLLSPVCVLHMELELELVFERHEAPLFAARVVARVVFLVVVQVQRVVGLEPFIGHPELVAEVAAEVGLGVVHREGLVVVEPLLAPRTLLFCV